MSYLKCSMLRGLQSIRLTRFQNQFCYVDAFKRNSYDFFIHTIDKHPYEQSVAPFLIRSSIFFITISYSNALR